MDIKREKIKFESGSTLEEFLLDGKLHREDDFAAIYTFSNGNQVKIWFDHGAAFRAGGMPVCVLLRADGRVAAELYCDEMERASSGNFFDVAESFLSDTASCRKDGPSIVIFRKDGKVKKEIYRYVPSKLDEWPFKDKPSVVEYYSNGNVKRAEFHNQSTWELDRAVGPALVNYNEDGFPMRKEFYKNGLLDRDDGPAVVLYDEDGNVADEKYFIKGKEIEPPGKVSEEGARPVSGTGPGF